MALIFISFFSGYLIFAFLTNYKKKREKELIYLTDEIIHELNIPISTINANILMLKRKEQDSKNIVRLERIEKASKRLYKLYQTLNYTLKKELYLVEKKEVEISQIVKERIEYFKELKRNNFILDLTLLKIKIDVLGFEQTFDNLISNAMKYSPKNSPIEITLKENKLSIKDRGIGISQTELLKIYEKYYQEDNNKKGEGLGLSIVKNYCDRENISIYINSKKERGTEVVLVFNFSI